MTGRRDGGPEPYRVAARRCSAPGGPLGSLDEDFRLLAITIVPEAADLDPARWRAVQAAVEDALASRPEALRRRFRLFLRVLGWLAVVRYGRPLASLDAHRRARLLASVERSRLPLLRRGFWGLRTLVYLGYWTREESIAAIGYRARPAGWEARR